MATSFKPRLAGVINIFSVRQLLSTLVAPWRRIITPPGRSLEDRWRSWIDNFFSRLIGLVVRLLVLLSAGVCLVTVAVLTLAELIIWPLLPPAVPACLIAGLII